VRKGRGTSGENSTQSEEKKGGERRQGGKFSRRPVNLEKDEVHYL